MKKSILAPSLLSGLAATLLLAAPAAAQCGVPDDALEDNDDCLSASAITTGTIPGLVLFGLGCTADEDYFRITVQNNEQLDVDALFTHANGDIDMEYWDVTGGCPGNLVLYAGSATDNESLSWGNVTGGPVDIVINTWAYGLTFTTNTYDLVVSISPYQPPSCTVPEDSFEENDDCFTAAPIPTGLTTGLVLYGHGCLMDEDYFLFTVPNDSQVVVDALFTHANGDINMEIYDTTGGNCPGVYLVYSGSGSDNESITWSNYSGAPADIVLNTWAGGGTSFYTNTYDLDITIGPAPPNPCDPSFDDVLEDNDDCATALPTPDGSYLGLWVSQLDPDLYSTSVRAGDTLIVDMWFSHSDADCDMYLWEAATCGIPGANLLWAASVDDNENIAWTNTTGGDMDLVIECWVWGPVSQSCAAYDLDISGGFIPLIGTSFCFGDGSDGGTCPCGNIPLVGSGEGCNNGMGVGAYLTADGTASVSADALVLTVHQAVPNDFGIFVQNTGIRTVPAPFYNGLFCLNADSHLVRHYAPPGVQPTVTDATGTGVNAQPMTVGDYLGDTQPGVTLYYQFWGRDNTGPCAFGANFSSGIHFAWMP